MLRPVLTVAAAGAVGFLVWKVLSILFLPFVGTLLAMFFVVLKVALLVGLFFLVLWWLRRDKPKDDEAPAS